MSQPLWYLRQNNGGAGPDVGSVLGPVLGPFPAPQVREFLASGEVTADWEISLDQIDWLTVRDSGQFEEAHPAVKEGLTKTEWRDERAMARHRWLGDLNDVDKAVPRDLAEDRRTRQALADDVARTDHLLLQAQNRRAPIWAGVLALLALAGVGVFVWWGQQQDSAIQTGIKLTAAPKAATGQQVDCSAVLTEATDWTRCNKRGANLQAVVARNARLSQVNLEGANLAKADLSYALLNMANLRNANMQGINLTGADLTGADLTGSDLSGADLRYAILAKAHMDGVRLQGAQLGKAIGQDGQPCSEGSVGMCQ